MIYRLFKQRMKSCPGRVKGYCNVTDDTCLPGKCPFLYWEKVFEEIEEIESERDYVKNLNGV